MSSGYRGGLSSVLGDYSNLRAVPAYLSAAFIIASLYQFGGIGEITLPWLSYTLTTQHSVVVSLAVLLVAFMGSSTRQFENYENVEKAAIAAGPAVILGAEYTTEFHDLLLDIGDPLGMQIAFFLTVVSWGVAVR